MSKRPTGYIIFITLMVLLALLGVVLIVTGRTDNTPLKLMMHGLSI